MHRLATCSKCTPVHRQTWLEFTREYVNLTVHSWKVVVFSLASAVCVFMVTRYGEEFTEDPVSISQNAASLNVSYMAVKIEHVPTVPMQTVNQADLLAGTTSKSSWENA